MQARHTTNKIYCKENNKKYWECHRQLYKIIYSSFGSRAPVNYKRIHCNLNSIVSDNQIDSSLRGHCEDTFEWDACDCKITKQIRWSWMLNALRMKFSTNYYFVCTRSPLPTFAREIGDFVVHTSLRKHQIPNTLTLEPYALVFINKRCVCLRAASLSSCRKQVRWCKCRDGLCCDPWLYDGTQRAHVLRHHHKNQISNDSSMYEWTRIRNSCTSIPHPLMYAQAHMSDFVFHQCELTKSK